jgi:hypothetical protein
MKKLLIAAVIAVGCIPLSHAPLAHAGGCAPG